MDLRWVEVRYFRTNKTLSLSTHTWSGSFPHDHILCLPRLVFDRQYCPRSSCKVRTACAVPQGHSGQDDLTRLGKLSNGSNNIAEDRRLSELVLIIMILLPIMVGTVFLGSFKVELIYEANAVNDVVHQ
jgi:hypothetical protein